MTKRIALITGGMGGLGESISTTMHDAGFRVVVTHSPGNKNAACRPDHLFVLGGGGVPYRREHRHQRRAAHAMIRAEAPSTLD